MENPSNTIVFIVFLGHGGGQGAEKFHLFWQAVCGRVQRELQSSLFEEFLHFGGPLGTPFWLPGGFLFALDFFIIFCPFCPPPRTHPAAGEGAPKKRLITPKV